MKHKLSVIVPLAMVVMSLVLATPAFAQSCPARTPELTLSTADMGDLSFFLFPGAVMQTGDAMRICGENISVDIQYFDLNSYQPPVSFNVSNSSGFGSGSVTMNAREMTPTVVDLSALPKDEYDLWTKAMSAVGKLLESPEFIKTLEDNYPDKAANYKEGFAKFRDGYYVPSSWVSALSISRVTRQNIVGSSEAKLGRGYSFNGPFNFELISRKPEGDPNPDLYLTTFGNMGNGHMEMHVDIVNGVNEISGYAQSYQQTLTEREYAPQLGEIRAMLLYLLDQVPEYENLGIIEKNSEMPFLFEKFLEGLDKYPIRVIPQPQP